MARPHPPAQARGIVAAARAGADAKGLAAEARGIDDPYHAAWALFQLAQDEPGLGHEALKLFSQVPQDWRRAELAADVARHVKDDTELLDALTANVVALPASKARSAALQELAKRLSGRRIPSHVARLLDAPGGGEDAKTLLRAWAQHPAGTVDEAIARADADTRAQLLGYLHLQGAKAGTALVPQAFARAVAAAQDAADRVEALRYLATLAQDELELDALLVTPLGGEERVRLLARLVARADQLGSKPKAQSYLEEAMRLAAAVADDKTRTRLEGNLQKAAARLHEKRGKPAAARGKARDVRRASTASLPPAPGPRARLALHNGYTGNFGAPHIRAVARAAPLCAAYGLDLLLIGFPTDDMEEIVERVEKETRVGEGGEYARLLLEADRLTHVPREIHTRPDEWDIPGAVVVTTPHPDPAKTRELRETGDAPIVVMGLGPEGLPPQLVKRARYHVEITGHGISLETATAMGIIAERLRRT